MRTYPFIRLREALFILRVAVAVFFMAHAVMRIVNGSIPQFSLFMGNIGFPQPTLWVVAITTFEIIAGVLLALGYAVKWLVPGFMAIALGGIVLIHARLGWFVGEHGVGGMEYSVSLLVSLLVLLAAENTNPPPPDSDPNA